MELTQHHFIYRLVVKASHGANPNTGEEKQTPSFSGRSITEFAGILILLQCPPLPVLYFRSLFDLTYVTSSGRSVLALHPKHFLLTQFYFFLIAIVHCIFLCVNILIFFFPTTRQMCVVCSLFSHCFLK